MGIQCHVEPKDLFTKMESITITRIREDYGDGPNQDQPWDNYVGEVKFFDGKVIAGNISLNKEGELSNFWFDANHWGSNRWQIEVLKDNLVPLIES